MTESEGRKRERLLEVNSQGVCDRIGVRGGNKGRCDDKGDTPLNEKGRE